jgi:SAM-dependent methyltransferase
VQEGILVDFFFQTDQIVDSPRLPFVSYPSEWCDAQLSDAAKFTLAMSQRILGHGLELKDASAANVLFNGSAPIFCDHLSFLPIKTKQWWAMGQFARHFIFPLVLARQTKLHGFQFHAISTDGLGPSDAASLLGLRRFLSGAWPLMIGASSGVAQRAPSALKYSQLQQGESSYHAMLYNYCDWCLPNQSRAKKSLWSDYTHNRPHYSADVEKKKRQLVQAWLAQIAPTWVVDLGCNTGEFTQIATQAGASVIAIDSDHDSIEQLYSNLVQSQIKTAYPVIANLADLSSGGGWLAQEKFGLLERLSGHADLVLCLGLLHHLIATEGVALNRVVNFLSNLTESTLVLELIAPEDPMAQMLMRQRNRTDAFPKINQQLDALSSAFIIVKQESLGSTRELVLMQKVV